MIRRRGVIVTDLPKDESERYPKIAVGKNETAGKVVLLRRAGFLRTQKEQKKIMSKFMAKWGEDLHYEQCISIVSNNL